MGPIEEFAGPHCEVTGPLYGNYGSHPENGGNGDIFRRGNRVRAPSPRSTCGVPLTTLRPFSEIENAWLSASRLDALSMLDSDTSKLDDLGPNPWQRRCWWLLANGQGNIKVEIMQNLQVLNSFCSFEIPDIFLFETRFKK